MKTKNTSEEYWKDHARYLQYELSVTRGNLEAAQYKDWSNLNSRIKFKEDQRLYKKVGKKFVPVNDPYAYDGLREGFWLIKVSEGCTSIRQQVYPCKSAITAAARDLEDKIIEIIRKATEARPQKTPLSPEEKKDWETFIAKHRDSFNILSYPSFQQSAEMIVQAILKEEY
jgi:hypothetical protein